MRITLESPDQPELIALIDELDAYQKVLYPPESHHGIDLATLLQPKVRFAVVRDQAGAAVGCGAIVLEQDYAELKRMYLRPAHRNRGLAGLLLQHLESAALAACLTVVRLETGIHQHAAIHFYERSGYTRTPPFGDYRPDPLSIFMRKQL